jgi:hypothetical protein
MVDNTVATVSQMSDSQVKINQLANGISSVFNTDTDTSFAGRIKALDAITNAEPLADHLDETINLRNVIVQATEITDAVTGIPRDALRIILIDADGSAYAAVSDGLYRSLENIFGMLGMPAAWENPLPIKVVEVRGRNGFRFFTVRIVSE